MAAVARHISSHRDVSGDLLIKATVAAYAPALTQMGPLPFVLVCMHLGPSVEVACTRGGRVRRGREVAGDLDIVPAHTPSTWELKQPAHILIVRVPEGLLRHTAQQLNLSDPSIEIADRFLLRDPVLEHLCWAIKAEVDAGHSTGPEFLQMIGRAMAVRLLQRHSARSLPMREVGGGVSAAKVKAIVTYIEDNLGQELPLSNIAQVVGVSVSHLKSLFKQATGTPVHQYVLRRRVERAAAMINDRQLSIAQIATAVGFAHQSHLSRHMRKYLATTPSQLRNQA